jgi:hypothetical protein
MRRLWFPAAFVVILSIHLPGWAQRGGGMRGGMSGMRSSGFHAGMRAGGSAHLAGVSHSGSRFGSSFRGPSRGERFRNNGFNLRIGNRRYAPRYGYPYYGGYYSPFYGDWWGSSYDSSNDDYAQQQMSRQIDDLSQEVQRLREDREDREYPRETASASVPRPPVEAALEKPNTDLPIVLVFLDKHIQEIKNYAVINETLMVYDGPRTHKIPLMDIDLAATLKLNDERGVAFPIPN